MYLQAFQELGLSKNEAEVYEALLEHGESSVAELVVHSGVYHRNVYDTLHRLLEKGLVLEIIQSRENHYQAIDPQKIASVVEEERQMLSNALPGMRALFEQPPQRDETVVYRGIEGWKSFLRDVLRVGQDLRVIGAKQFWTYPALRSFIPDFLRTAEESNVAIRLLIDSQSQPTTEEFLAHPIVTHKILPVQFSTQASVNVFGDYVTLVSRTADAGEEPQASFTVLLNPRLAQSFGAWFEMIWGGSAESSPEKQE